MYNRNKQYQKVRFIVMNDDPMAISLSQGGRHYENGRKYFLYPEARQ